MADIEFNPQPAITFFMSKMEEHAKRIADEIYEESQKEVPVDTGKLKLSGKVVKTDGGYHIVYKAINGDVDYAIRQHEDVELNHPNGGKSHFLRDPAIRVARRYNG